MGAAFEKFQQSLELATALIKLEKKFPDNPLPKDQSFVKGLRGGATVLMVASFEFFVRQLFEENLSKLNTNPLTINSSLLPEKLQEKNVFHSLKRAMEGPLFSNKPPLAQRLNETIRMCDLLVREHINPDAFSETGSNPNGERVKEKFKEIGVSDIFGKIKRSFEVKWKFPVADTFIKDTLDNIVVSRHIVAHTADTLNITRQFLNDSIKFLKIISRLLEREMLKQIKHLKRVARR